MRISRFERARLQPCRNLLAFMLALATEGPRGWGEVRLPSGAEAQTLRAHNGTAEAVPLQSYRNQM